MTPAQRLVLSNFATGFENDREPFIIDNDAFPLLQNMYLWRGKIQKKRGTSLLGRLGRFIPGNGTRAHTGTSTIAMLDGAGNLSATSLITVFSLQSGSNIIPGSISFSDGTNTYTDNSLGVITGVPGGTGTINYATSSITITGGAPNQNLVGFFQYYPNLPVMGIEDFKVISANAPIQIFFDTVYSYQFDQTNNIFYDVSFYKATKNPLVWSGQNYQQFWSTNYYGAMWATNNKPGFHFKLLTNTLAGAQSAIRTAATTATIGLTGHGLATGDYVWINEVVGTIATGSGSSQNQNINGQTGIVTLIDANSFTLTVAGANFQAGATGTGGIAQYLTRSISGQDGIRWYDGDPTLAATPDNLGWVNFAPPLSNVASPNYLVGALAIVPFKDRLLFFGPYVQNSSGSAAVLLQDTVVYSQNGTPFYSTLVPSGQTAPTAASSWWQNITGFGGFISAGIQQPIVTVMSNEDVLLVEFPNKKTKLVYTSNDLIPFLFYSINSELGSQSTFSAITLDTGGVSIGQYGIAMTTQNSAQRIDLLIPDNIFEITQSNFGVNRICAIRDFRNEFIYFTYPQNENPSIFPTQTLVFNYRENNWAIFIENFTTYGNYRPTSNLTWATLPYRTWAAWTDPWNSGKGNTNYPFIAGGNQQGFVILKDDAGIREAQSQYIQSITISGSTVTINSPSHGMQGGDYLLFNGCIGVTNINGTVRKILSITDTNNFTVDTVSPNVVPSGTYLGGGTYARLTVPFLQTKQFPIFWDSGRKVRIGAQRYLFQTTTSGQLTIALFVNQNDDIAANSPPIYPDNNPFNSAVIYTQTCLTSPEPNDPYSQSQNQIWHRMNTSLIGDTVQIGLTLSDTQMRDSTLTIQNSDIVLHAIVIDVYPSGVLAF